MIISMIFIVYGYSQSGALKGKITDKFTGESIPFANVVLEIDSEMAGGATSDFDGNYFIKPIEPGSYDLKVTYVGYQTLFVKGIVINPNEISFYDIEMESSSEMLEEIVVTEYSLPLIDVDRTYSGGTVSGVFSAGSETKSVRGSRTEQTIIYVDGIRIIGSESPAKHVKRKSLAFSEEEVQLEEGIKSGLLTAGEINDFGKWKLWKEFGENELKQYKKVWNIFPENRYCVQVMSKESFPVVGCKVELKDEQDNVVWTTRTDNTGKAELWAGVFSDIKDDKSQYKIVVTQHDKSMHVEKPKPFHKKVNSVILDTPCENPATVDILFAVDATGSMGDEINYLKAELKDIVEKFAKGNPDLFVRMGSIFYRDLHDEYITRKSDFSRDFQKTIDFISLQSAGGGGDTPEAVDDALEVAMNEMSWSKNARAKLLFLVLDAPPHSGSENIEKIQKAVEMAAANGIRIIPITASGIDKSGEYLMRAMALATNGTYVFLTNHSGIGGDHIEPTIDDYEVELLNDLILRLLYQFTIVEDCKQPDLPTDDITTVTDPFEDNNSDESDDDSDLTSGDDVEDPKPMIKVYPNPTTGIVNIKHSKKVKEIFVVDISGKLILRHTCEKGKIDQIDLSRFPNGFYFVKYANVNHYDYAKIILRH